MTNTSNIVVEPPIDGISRIKLNEPSTYNALSLKTLESLINIFKNLNNENETKIIANYGNAVDTIDVDFYNPSIRIDTLIIN